MCRQQHSHLSGAELTAWDGNMTGGGPDSLSNSSMSINSSGLTVILDRQNNLGAVIPASSGATSCCHHQSSTTVQSSSKGMLGGAGPIPLLPVLPSTSASQLPPGGVYILEAVVPPSSAGNQQRSPFHILADMHGPGERSRSVMFEFVCY